MIPAVLIAAAFAAGVDPRRLAALAAAVYFPVVVGTVVLFLVWRARPRDDQGPALFCEVVASELRSGATLRDALDGAAASVGISLAGPDPASGTPPLPETAAQVARSFPGISEELRLTVIGAGRAGSDSAALFDEIGALALAQSEIRHEIRVATAPGRATAFLLVGAPVLYVGSRLESGALTRMLASGQQRVVALAGLGLFLFGLALAAIVLWRAGR